MYCIGIDVGGTNLVAGLVDAQAQLKAKTSMPVNRTEDAGQLVGDMIELTRRLCREQDVEPEEVRALGLGIPGSVDNRTGTIVRTVNMPFRDTPVRALFQAVWEVPVFLGNDANCAAIGEYWAGAAKNCDPAVVVTLGTGVGGGLVAGGRIFDGFAGSGMEVGHIITHAGGLPCTCGSRGCWEQYGSATALIRETRKEMERSPDSALWEVCGHDLDKVEGRTPFDAAAQGDPAALRVLEGYRAELAAGLISIVNMLQPEIICIGGGVSNASDELLLDPLRELVHAGSCDRDHPVRIEKAALGNDAGIIGAALLCRSV